MKVQNKINFILIEKVTKFLFWLKEIECLILF